MSHGTSKQPGQIEWLRDIVRRLEASTYQDRVVLQLPQAKALLAEIDARPCPKHESGRHWCGNCFEWVGAVETGCKRCGGTWTIRDPDTNMGGQCPDCSPTQRTALLERIAALATELCVSVDKAAEDIGGERPALEILREIGPLTDQLEKLGPEPAAGVGVIDLAGSSPAETECKSTREGAGERPADVAVPAVPLQSGCPIHGRCPVCTAMDVLGDPRVGVVIAGPDAGAVFKVGSTLYTAAPNAGVFAWVCTKHGNIPFQDCAQCAAEQVKSTAPICPTCQTELAFEGDTCGLCGVPR